MTDTETMRWERTMVALADAEDAEATARSALVRAVRCAGDIEDARSRYDMAARRLASARSAERSARAEIPELLVEVA